MGRSLDSLIQEFVAQKKIEIVETRLLTAEEYVKYKDILIESNKDFSNRISSSMYSYEQWCVFNPDGGATCSSPTGKILGAARASAYFAPAIVFKSERKYEPGHVFSKRNCNFLVLDDNLAIYCEKHDVPDIHLTINPEVAIYAKSRLKYLLDKWTECLFDESREMPNRYEVQDWYYAYLKTERSMYASVEALEQKNEPHIEIDAFRSLCRYIPAIGETDVILPDGIESISAEAFLLNQQEKAPIRSIHLPRSLKFIEAGAFWDLHELESITVHPENTAFMTVDNVLFGCKEVAYEEWVSNQPCHLEPKTLICYPPQKKDVTEYICPPCVNVYAGAFSGSQLEAITIDTFGLEERGSNWLRYYWVDDYAFRNCKNLSRVAIGKYIYFKSRGHLDAKKLSFRGCHHFDGCNYGLRVNFDKRVTQLIPEGLISRSGKEMFYATSPGDEWHVPTGVERLNRAIRLQIYKKVVFSDSCLRIPSNEFSYGELEEVYLGANIKVLRGSCFAGCNQLRLICGEALEHIDETGEGFDACCRLKRVVVGPNCSFTLTDEDTWFKRAVIEAPKGSQTIENAKNAGLPYKEI